MKAKVILNGVGFVLSIVNVVIAARAAGYFLSGMAESTQSLESHNDGK